MGAAESSISDRGMQDLSAKDVSQYITQLGKNFQTYGDAVEENAVDGELLASMIDPEEMRQALDCLGITNFLHRRILLKEWSKAQGRGIPLIIKGAPSPQKTLPDETPLRRRRSSATFPSTQCSSPSLRQLAAEDSDDSDLTIDNDFVQLTYFRRHLSEESEAIQEEPQEVSAWTPACPKVPISFPMAINTKQREIIDELRISKDSTALPPDSEDLEPFRNIAAVCLDDTKSSLAGVNLLYTSHFEDKAGINNLCCETAGKEEPNMLHFDTPGGYDPCRRLILGYTQEDFYMEDMDPEVSKALGLQEPARYYGHVIRIDGERIGTIWTMLELSKAHETLHDKRVASLKFCAEAAERQMEQRQALLQRVRYLKQNIDELQEPGVDRVLIEASAPVKAVMASHLAGRETIFPYPQEPESRGANGSPTSPKFSRRSFGLPYFSPINQANQSERMHIDFDDHPSMDPSVIGRRDMERVALLKSMGLLQIEPESPEAQAIQQIVDLTGPLLGADMAFLGFPEHKDFYDLFPTFPRGMEVATPKLLQAFKDHHEVLQFHPATGAPFKTRTARTGQACNYTVMTPSHQSFVVHNTAEDQSLVHYKDLLDVGFTSGSPIIVHGHALGSFCIINIEARSDFTRAQEVRQEQLAHIIGQYLENWVLRIEFQKLERHKSILTSSCLVPSAPRPAIKHPEGYAAIVRCSIADYQSILNVEPVKLRRALRVNDAILKSKAAKHGGYEVATGTYDAFEFVFSDVVDAVSFCLQSQEALYQAEWPKAILALPEARDETDRKLRGLQIKMAIHCGEIDTSVVPLTGQVRYMGETTNIVQYLAYMAHGGQILVTSDVWDIASHFVDNLLHTPQVIDLGSHIMPSESGNLRDGVTSRSILQLLPKALAPDYAHKDNESTLTGRIFPPIDSAKCTRPSFHAAPCPSNKIVSMLHIDTSAMRLSTKENSELVLASLHKLISTTLEKDFRTGYQCDDDLLVFEDNSEAVRFGLTLQARLENEKVMDRSLKHMLKIGVHESSFERITPHSVTGKATYSGHLLSLTRHISDAAQPGTVFLGKTESDLDVFLQPAGNGFLLNFSTRMEFPGFGKREMILYKCQESKSSWHDEMMETKIGRNTAWGSRWQDYY